MGDCACHAGDLGLQWDGESLAFAFLELTPACNNRCVGCSNVFADHRVPAPLGAETWRALIDKLAPHVAWLKLTGGEPTLHPDFPQIVAHLNARGVPFRLLTNGRWPDREETLALLADSPTVESLLISLHGPDAPAHEAFARLKGAFDQARETIRRAAGAGLKVGLSTVLTRHNWNHVDTMVEVAQNLGADHVAFNRYIGPALPLLEPSRRHLVTALRRVQALLEAGAPVRFGTPVPPCVVPTESRACLAGRAFLTVDPWGRVRPCNHAPLEIGNLRAEPVERVLASPALHAWLDDAPPLCAGCALQATCGGCRAEAMLRGQKMQPRFAPAAQSRPQPAHVSPLASG